MKLQAKNREVTGSKVKNIRKEGLIPAVLYGKGVDNINISLELKEFARVFKEAGENTVLDLVVDVNGKTEERNVLVSDVSFDPVSDVIIHVDLHEINMNEKVSANIPLVFEGESFAVKSENGVLVKNFHEIEVYALPRDLPHDIKVDLTMLSTFDDVVRVADLKIPANVEVEAGPEDIVASVTPPRSQEELEALEEEQAPVDLSNVKTESEEKKAEKEKESAE